MEQVLICNEYCDELLCQATARNFCAMSPNTEDESADECQAYVPTHSENLLTENFMAHFKGEIPSYNDTTKSLIEDFASVSSNYFILKRPLNILFSNSAADDDPKLGYKIVLERHFTWSKHFDFMDNFNISVCNS